MKKTILFTILTLFTLLGATAETVPDAARPAAEDSLRMSGAEAGKTKRHFLPTRRRIDREINKLKFAYKGEVMMGLTASYGTLTSDDTDFMIILDNINADGTMASVRPFAGYFYRDNRCIGVRFGYTHIDGTLNNMRFDMGESNDISAEIPYVNLQSDLYELVLFMV